MVDKRPRSLFEAVQEFTRPNLWAAYRACFDDDRAAGEHICQPDAAFFHFELSTSKKRGDLAPQFEILLQKFDLKAAVLQEFQSALSSGVYDLTGINPIGQSASIPFDLISSAKFNFRSNTLTSGGIEFLHVHLHRSGRISPQEIERRTDEVATWLRSQPKAKRKDLEEDARVQFPWLTGKVFTTAYSSVFNYAQGRPRNKSKN